MSYSRTPNFEQVLAGLPTALAVLFYGGNRPWMEEESAAMIAHLRQQEPSLAITRLASDQLVKEPHRLHDALSSPGLFSAGRQVVVISDVDEKSGAMVVELLQSAVCKPADALLLLLAPAQHATARWIQPFKIIDACWLRDCYDETPAVRTAFIQRWLRGQNKIIEPAALSMLQSHLPEDRLLALQDLERLGLLAGTASNIDEAMVEQALALQLEASVYELGQAYLTKNTAWLAARTGLIDETGIAPMAVLRSLQTTISRLLTVKGAELTGLSQAAAIEQLQPKIFFRHRPDFEEALQKFGLRELQQMLSELMLAEQRLKQTGFPANELTSWALWRLASA
jgi:DNA polymerase-3 subunit delta